MTPDEFRDDLAARHGVLGDDALGDGAVGDGAPGDGAVGDGTVGDPPTVQEVLRAAPDVARVAATSAWHALRWSVGASLAGANYVTRRAIDGQPPAAIVQEAAHDLRGFAVRTLGLGGGENGAVRTAGNDDTAGSPGAPGARPGSLPGASESRPVDLQKRGDDLLRRSNDVHVVEDTHPAFARILGELTPDEARILRFLFLDGPQPSVDVRTWRPLGIGSMLVAQRLTMLAEQAGCRNLARTSQYLINLARLGLIDLSAEPVSNPQRYQVIEAQPAVTDAMKQAGRMPHLVHGSILLTSFGSEFVLTCLPVNERAVPRRVLPGRGATP